MNDTGHSPSVCFGKGLSAQFKSQSGPRMEFSSEIWQWRQQHFLPFPPVPPCEQQQNRVPVQLSQLGALWSPHSESLQPPTYIRKSALHTSQELLLAILQPSVNSHMTLPLPAQPCFKNLWKVSWICVFCVVFNRPYTKTNAL